MIITIVTDVLGQENNGTTITAKRLIGCLRQRGHEVRVVSPLKTEEQGYFSVPKRNFYVFNEYVAKNGVELAKPDKYVLSEAIAGSDIVHIILPFKLGRTAFRVAQELGIPCTAAFHCQPENITSHIFLKDFKPANDYVYRRFNRKFYRHVGHIHCPSEYIAGELHEHGYQSKLHVISNGVSPVYHRMDSPKPEEYRDRFCILFTGRFSKEKRHDLLIEAALLSRHRERIQLIFAGNGPQLDHVMNLAQRLPNPVKVGFYPAEELNRIINFCDLYVHPADVEIEAIACLEAITCGLVPVISNSPRSATRNFAFNEKFLFDVGNAQSLADRIDYWIEHEEEKRQLSGEYIAYAERFRLEHSIDLMEQMFREAVQEERA